MIYIIRNIIYFDNLYYLTRKANCKRVYSANYGVKFTQRVLESFKGVLKL